MTPLEDAYGIHAFGGYPLKTVSRYFMLFDVSGSTCVGGGFLTLAGGRVQLCTNKHMLVADDEEEEDRYEYIVLFHWHINQFVYRKYKLWENDQSLYTLHPSPLNIDLAVLDIGKPLYQSAILTLSTTAKGDVVLHHESSCCSAGCQSEFTSLALLPQTPFKPWQGDVVVIMGFPRPGLYAYLPYPRWNQRFALLVPATLSSPPDEVWHLAITLYPLVAFWSGYLP